MSPESVAVCIVTHDSAADLPGCLESISALDHRPLEVVMVDCASRDGSLETARAHAPAGIPFQAVGLSDVFLERGEIVPYFQPIVELSTRRIVRPFNRPGALPT